MNRLTAWGLVFAFWGCLILLSGCGVTDEIACGKEPLAVYRNGQCTGYVGPGWSYIRLEAEGKR